jgi:hypothetical protein
MTIEIINVNNRKLCRFDKFIGQRFDRSSAIQFN